MRKALVLVSALATVGAGCGDASPGAATGAAVVPLAGEITVLHDGAWKTVKDTFALSHGDHVQSAPGARARVELPGGHSLELASDTRLRVDRPNQPELVRGNVLATAGPGLTLLVDRFRVTARESVFRVDRGLALRVAVYSGLAKAPGSGWEGPISAFQQIGVVGGGTVPSGPQPLRVQPDDPWDLRFLAEAIDVGGSLQRQETGLTNQLRGRRVRAAVLEALRGLLPKDTIDELLAVTTPAELILAALVSAASTPADLVATINEVLGLRRSGASWIVVAGWLGVDRTVLTSVAGAVSRALGEIRVPGRGRPGGAGGGAGGAAAGGGGAATGGGAGTGGGGGGRNTGGGSNDDPAPPPPPSGCQGSAVECAIEGIVDNPLGGVG